MKKFIKKMFRFIIAFIFFLFFKQCIISYYLPYHHGVPEFSDKILSYEETEEGFNTVFFGSSRIYRHVNPVLFDSVLSDKNIKSFNFGVPSMYNPESYIIFEEFIRQNKNKIDYAFLEISTINKGFFRGLNSTRETYWTDISEIKYAFEYSYYSPMKLEGISVLTKYFFSLFDFQVYKPNINSSTLKGDNKGFYPLDREYKEYNSLKLEERHRHLFKDTSMLAEKRAAATLPVSYYENRTINQAHYNRLINLIQLAKSNNIYLFIIVPPRLDESDYSQLIPIAEQLPNENIIYMHQKLDYYAPQNSFDLGHFNSKGARLFTKALAERLNIKLSSIE